MFVIIDPYSINDYNYLKEGGGTTKNASEAILVSSIEEGNERARSLTTSQPTYKEAIDAFNEEARNRGFIEARLVKNSIPQSRVTYKCARTGKVAKFMQMPDRVLHTDEVEVALTDGCGGYIYWEGKWAEIVN